jgi:hypothetical protein
MQRYKIISLVDITRSLPSRVESDNIKIGQQANFNSLLQAIGLRSNIEWDSDPIQQSGRLPENIDGKAVHWIWEFTSERDQVFQKDLDPVGLLLTDLHGIPVVTGLNNSIELTPPMFQTKSNNQNTWVYLISSIG